MAGNAYCKEPQETECWGKIRIRSLAAREQAHKWSKVMHSKRPITHRIVAIVLPVVALAIGWPAAATTAPPATLKERLSDKASDNQRVDNCRVPVERRGPKPRPDCGTAARKQ
jgi:hypothetical protein